MSKFSQTTPWSSMISLSTRLGPSTGSGGLRTAAGSTVRSIHVRSFSRLTRLGVVASERRGITPASSATTEGSALSGTGLSAAHPTTARIAPMCSNGLFRLATLWLILPFSSRTQIRAPASLRLRGPIRVRLVGRARGRSRTGRVLAQGIRVPRLTDWRCSSNGLLIRPNLRRSDMPRDSALASST